MGKIKPLATWAKRIISTGLILNEEKIIPKIKTTAHTDLNFTESIPPFQPRQPFTTKAAANGAVIEDVIPAANKPIAMNIVAAEPNNGSRPAARSAALEIELRLDAAAQIIIAIETTPPRIIETTSSLRTLGKDSYSVHFSLTNEACKNRL